MIPAPYRPFVFGCVAGAFLVALLSLWTCNTPEPRPEAGPATTDTVFVRVPYAVQATTRPDRATTFTPESETRRVCLDAPAALVPNASPVIPDAPALPSPDSTRAASVIPDSVLNADWTGLDSLRIARPSPLSVFRERVELDLFDPNTSTWTRTEYEVPRRRFEVLAETGFGILPVPSYDGMVGARINMGAFEIDVVTGMRTSSAGTEPALQGRVRRRF